MRLVHVIEVVMVGRTLNGLFGADSDDTVHLSGKGTLVQPAVTRHHSGVSNGDDSSLRHHPASRLLQI